MVWKMEENNTNNMIDRSCKRNISFGSTRNVLKNPQKRFENKGSDVINTNVSARPLENDLV